MRLFSCMYHTFLDKKQRVFLLTCWFHPLLAAGLNHQTDDGKNQLAAHQVAAGWWDQSPRKNGDGAGQCLSQDALLSTVGYWG